MDINDKNDAPMGWRTKMKRAETVDAGITFQGGKGYGGHWTAWNRHRLDPAGKRLTRSKFLPYITNNTIGNHQYRKVGKLYG